MRKYHRWLAPLLAIFLLWIAVTGLAIQAIKLTTPSRPGPPVEEASGPITAARAHEHEEAAKPAAPVPLAPATATAATPAAPESNIDRIRRERHDLSEFVMDLHSGKSFGPIGTWLSIAGGLALVFFGFSGLWMYIRMWSHRRRNSHKPAWFWK